VVPRPSCPGPTRWSRRLMKGSVTSIRVFEVFFFFCFSFTLPFFAIFCLFFFSFLFFFFFASHPPPFCFSPAEFSTDFCLIFCFPFFSLPPLSISVSYSFFFLSPLFLLRSTLGKTVIKHYDIEIEAYTGALCDFICNSSIHFSYLSFYLNNCKS
jgi:hypothetical protein